MGEQQQMVTYKVKATVRFTVGFPIALGSSPPGTTSAKGREEYDKYLLETTSAKGTEAYEKFLLDYAELLLEDAFESLESLQNKRGGATHFRSATIVDCEIDTDPGSERD